MTTNLLIGYPDIPLRADAVSIVGGTADSSYPASNLVTGSRGDRFALDGDEDDVYIQYDMGAGNTATVDYLYIARANLLTGLGAHYCLLVGYDGVSTSNILGLNVGIGKADLVGPDGHDLMCASGRANDIGGTFPSAAYRYWRLSFGNSGAAATWTFSKAYFGRLFDFGRDPHSVIVDEMKRIAPAARRPVKTISIDWTGITDAVLSDFIDKIGKWQDVSPIVLYDSNDYWLQGAIAVHCKVTSAKVRPVRKGVNEVRVTCEELI